MGGRKESLSPRCRAGGAVCRGSVHPAQESGRPVHGDGDGPGGAAYAESLAAVDYLVRTNGMGDVERLLERLPRAISFEAAMRETLRLDYEELDENLKKYLSQQFGNR